MLYQRQILPLAATLAVAVLAACGGGGSTGSSIPLTTPAGTPTPTAAPTHAPTAAPTHAPTAAPTLIPTAAPTTAAAPLGTAILAGASGFVNAQSHTVYVFDADLAAPGTSTCNGQCATVWPSVAAAANTALPAPWTAIKRSDGSLQLAYAGRPLYTYIADSAPGSIAGNGITSFGAVWHIARPQGAAGTPTPAATPSATAAPTPAPY